MSSESMNPDSQPLAGAQGKAGMRHLDSRVKMVWELPTLITLAVFWLVASVAYFTFMPGGAILGLSHAFFPIALLLAALILVGLPLHIWVGMIYDNFTIELAPQDIIIREGVFTRKTTVIPYARIQDIRSERTITERFFGIATLEIETAGSSKVASQTLIPGIADKNELIREIMRNVEIAKSGDGTSARAEGVAIAQKSASTMEFTLLAILKELKTISFKLDNLPRIESQRAVNGQKAVPLTQAAKKKSSEFEEYEKFRKK